MRLHRPSRPAYAGAATAILLGLTANLAPAAPALAAGRTAPTAPASASPADRAATAASAAALKADAKRHSRARSAKHRTATSSGTMTTSTTTSSTTTTTSTRTASTRTMTSYAKAKPGPTPAPSGGALVLYDTNGEWGYLGELYADYVKNLASRFGAVTAEPIGSYTAGQLANFTATFYLGSTYDSAPSDFPSPSFLRDVASTSKPVVWAGDNIWDLGGSMGASAFVSRYGWDSTQSYFHGPITTVTYKGKALTRNAASGDVISPYNIDASKVTVLAQGSGQDANGNSVSFPWAIRSANLTYLGEIPISYATETDRVIAFADLMYDVLAPSTAARHRALVRLEDISPASDPSELRDAANYLYSEGVPFGFNVIPVYKDPNGYYNNGVPQTITLSQAPKVVDAINYMLNHGGTLIDEGYTHQYSNIADPYDGVTGDDCEFFLSHIDSANNVIFDGPVSQDSQKWAQGRITNAFNEFAAAGLPKPTFWVTPHYYASATDYKVFAANFPVRYDRGLYYKGLLTGGTIDSSTYIGQFFPYVVTDLYGQKVLPENLGDYEPVELNNHPPRLETDIIHEADLNLAVRDGFASFFYDASNGTGPLKTIVAGIKGLGYTFVAPTSL